MWNNTNRTYFKINANVCFQVGNKTYYTENKFIYTENIFAWNMWKLQIGFVYFLQAR